MIKLLIKKILREMKTFSYIVEVDYLYYTNGSYLNFSYMIKAQKVKHILKGM